MSEYIKKCIDKVLSARFIITIMLSYTFCWITVKSLNLFMVNLASDKLPLIEKIVFFLLGSFCTKVGDVITSYFDRSDRTQPNGGKNV